MSKLYTSRYSNPTLINDDYIKVGVTLYPPRFPLKYTRTGNIVDIAPTKDLFRINNKEIFKKAYCEKLNKIGIEKIKKQLDSYLSKGKDVVLLCYEDVRKEEEWCHRQVFAEWWESKTGEKIEELKDTSKVAGAKKIIKEKEEIIPNMIQLALF